MMIILLLTLAAIIFALGATFEMLADFEFLQTKKLAAICFFFCIIALTAIAFFCFGVPLFELFRLAFIYIIACFFIGLASNDKYIYESSAKIGLVLCVLTPLAYALGV